MFSDPLTVQVETPAAPADEITRSFALVSLGENSSTRRVIAGTPGWPNTLRISHQTSGKGENTRVRHLARFDVSEVIPVEPVPGSGDEEVAREGNTIASMYVVLDMPKGWEMTRQGQLLARHLLGLMRGNPGTPINWDNTESLEPDLTWLYGWINGQV